MGYAIDFSKVTLDQCKIDLLASDLVPSRMMIKEKIDHHFQKMKQSGLHNVAELLEATKTKTKLVAFSKSSGIDQEYLTILVRELKSQISKPNRIKDFPGLPNGVVFACEKIGIKNTRHLYPHILTKKARRVFAEKSNLDADMVMMLTRLTDLSRIRWVNHTFAHMLLVAGYENVMYVTTADDYEMWQRIKELNEKHQWFKGTIGQRDIRRCIHAAKQLPLEIEF